jgi:hypothetical protein
MTRILTFSCTQVQIIDLIWVLHIRLIIFLVGGDVPVDSETFLMTDFINFNINPI